MTPEQLLAKMKAHCVAAAPTIHDDSFAAMMPFTMAQLAAFGYHYYRVFASGEVWAVAPYSISNGRLFVDIHGDGYRDFYCFCDYPTALAALQAFDPVTMEEPQGWHRHFSSSRRRENGNPAKESIWR